MILQKLPEHEAFRRLLAAPQYDAAAIMSSRFPLPRYVVCDQHGSQARFLLAKVNPSVNGSNMGYTDGSVAPVFTDDVAFNDFMDKLMQLAVAST